MNVNEMHTDQLQGGEVTFPPQVFGHAWSHSCQAVIHVHHDMDEGVNQTYQESCRQTL